MFYRILIAALCVVSFAQAQDIQYVFAENGLIVREKPNQGSIKVGLLDYGTAVEVLEHTNLNLDIQDRNKKISGEWVKIRGTEADEFFDVGYVFNGFLTEEKIEKPLKVGFEPFTVFIEELDKHVDEKKVESDEDTRAFSVRLGETPENRYLMVKHHQEYRTIEVFQRHRNSVVLSNEGPHCDLVDYKHFNSSWKPLKMFSGPNNIYKTITFSPEDSQRFVEVDMSDLKGHVSEFCGEEWAELIKDIDSLRDPNIGIELSQIHIRIVMTDIDGYKTEKIIIFEIPMGC